jgi:hypothetical protein
VHYYVGDYKGEEIDLKQYIYDIVLVYVQASTSARGEERPAGSAASTASLRMSPSSGSRARYVYCDCFLYTAGVEIWFVAVHFIGCG